MKWFFMDTRCECGTMNYEKKIFDENGNCANRSDVEKVIQQRDELLEACKTMITALEKQAWPLPTDAEYNAYCVMIDAINKAEGNSETVIQK